MLLHTISMNGRIAHAQQGYVSYLSSHSLSLFHYELAKQSDHGE